MMYEFVDTIEHKTTAIRPAEAMKINGIYIEDVINGYRTLHVVGRELLTDEIESRQIGNKDGEEYLYKRHNPRVITVTYRLSASSSWEFRQAYNKLNQLLNVEEAQLVFDDEPDKYFIGTKASNNEVSGGTNNVIGEIEFYCADPKKYSVAETSFTAKVNPSGILETTIVNNGTESVPVTYDIKNTSENGFVGIVSEHGAIELGSIKELDGKIIQMSQELMHYTNYSGYNAMRTGQGLFFDSTYGKSGTFKEATYQGLSYLDVASPGTGSGWHGAAKSVTVPADKNGEVGATNFALQGKVWFQPTDISQLGIIEYAVADENGANLMSIRIAKWEPTREVAYLILCVGGKEKQRVEFNPFTSTMMRADSGEFYMVKSGDKFVFQFGGLYTFYAPELANKKGKTVSVFIGQRDSYYMVNSMRLQYLIFRKDNVSKWTDVPNRYAKGSRIHIDGNSAKVYVNGNEMAGDVVRGSDFFHVPPGETKVQFYVSGFAKTPEVTAKIREAYL